jgi:adenylate cyclase
MERALEEVLQRRLGDDRFSETGRLRLRRLASARHRELGVDGVGALLSLTGIDDTALGQAEQRLGGGLSHVARLGVTIEDLGVVGQAYARGVQPIATTEAEIIAATIRALPAAEQSRRLDALVDDAVRLARPTFELLHRAMLREALIDALAASETGSEAPAHDSAVAHVDIVGSTALLLTASPEDAHRIVDGLFEAAQTAVRELPVAAVKYAGDGVFLAGKRPLDVARAALACIDRLADGFDLQARAGLAYGPVVQRAGDFFGLTVNVSHCLTKAARPGSLLATALAAESLPEEMRGAQLSVAVKGLDDRVGAVEIRPGDHAS